jgi:2-polyprenyl-3-methyl-5-hydroxy-6-metoxy-1,4-benzoquinol methylase
MMLKTGGVKQTLDGSAVHEIWERNYRTPESERFYESVFDWIATHERLPGMNVLDIGCGIGQHAIRLARRGCKVVAADFSADRVRAAAANIGHQGFESQITVRNEDLQAGLSFADATFDSVLCWGVLMHVPQLVPAMHELVRVTRLGGRIFVYESNLFGVDAALTVFSTVLKRSVGRTAVRRVRLSEFGVEYWVETPAGELLIRHSRLRALVRALRREGCRLRYRISGEFTEKYSLGGPIRRLAHTWNRVWFSAGRIPYLATCNLLVFERMSST